MNEFYLQWHITDQCRNNCKHCYQSNHNGQFTTLEQAKLVLRSIVECEKELEAEPYIVLTGGDPTENPDFLEILELSLKVSRRTGILGNPEPILKNKKLVQQLIGISSYQLSIDGTKETHDKWRYKGSFSNTLKAIKVLKKAGIKVNIMSTVSQDNYKEMVDVMKIAYSYGADFWSFTRYCPPLGGHCGIEPENFLKFMREINDALKPYEAQGKPTQTREPLLCMVKKDTSELGGCGVGFSRMALLPDLTLMACRRHPNSILGKLTEEKGILWHFAMNPIMDNYRNFDLLEGCNECHFKNKCRGCRAAAFLATYKENAHDPQCVFLKNKREKNGIKNYFLPTETSFEVKCS